MLSFCCCAKSRQDESVLGSLDLKDKNLTRILLEFTTEESKIGLRNLQVLEMLEKIILVSTKEEIAKKEVVQIYKQLGTNINQESVRVFLTQPYFFTDNTMLKYDFYKVVLFNLLYCGGKDSDKINFLYGILETTSSSSIHNNSSKVVATLETITQICCIVVGEILVFSKKFHNQKEEPEFEELLAVYQTNQSIMKEFCNVLISTYLFPQS